VAALCLASHVINTGALGEGAEILNSCWQYHGSVLTVAIYLWVYFLFGHSGISVLFSSTCTAHCVLTRLTCLFMV